MVRALCVYHVLCQSLGLYFGLDLGKPSPNDGMLVDSAQWPRMVTRDARGNVREAKEVAAMRRSATIESEIFITKHFGLRWRH